MFDLVVSGGTHVLPGGAENVDLGVTGGKIVAIGAPGSLAAIGATRVVDAAGQIVIPGGIDPHIHCSMPMQMPNQPEPTVTGPPEQVSRAALFGGTTTLIDFVPVAEEQTLQAGDRTARARLEGRLLLRLRAASDAVRQNQPQQARRNPGGDPGRLRLGQDVHHRHHATAHGSHGPVRRHLGGDQGGRESRRPDLHPCRGQRPRHAHVREAAARGPHGLREPRRGPHHAVGRPGLQPGDPARRKRRGCGDVHGAHLRQDRRQRDGGGAGPRLPGLRRNPAPVPALQLPRTTSGRAGRSTTPTRR